MIAYAFCYVKCHFTEIFCASLLNSLPMGLYAPAQIVIDARKNSVKVRPVCTLEPIERLQSHAVTLGMRPLRSLTVSDAACIIATRADVPNRSGVSAARPACRSGGGSC